MLQPLFKSKNSKSSIYSWILEKFPENYEKLKYIEPYVNNGSILLNKKISIEECVGDANESIINIWKIIKDENKFIKNQLSKLKYNKKTFDLISKKNTKNYFKKYLYDFIIRKMSKNENLIFNSLDTTKAKNFWPNTIESLNIINNRIKNVYFLRNSPLEIISNFDNIDTFCFCCPPIFDEKKSIIDEYISMTDSLLCFHGKVVFLGNNCAFYRRIFKNWKLTKKNSKSKKAECIWTNF